MLPENTFSFTVSVIIKSVGMKLSLLCDPVDRVGIIARTPLRNKITVEEIPRQQAVARLGFEEIGSNIRQLLGSPYYHGTLRERDCIPYIAAAYRICIMALVKSCGSLQTSDCKPLNFKGGVFTESFRNNTVVFKKINDLRIRNRRRYA